MSLLGQDTKIEFVFILSQSCLGILALIREHIMVIAPYHSSP